MKKYILKWELAGIIFVFLVGALLHFLFEWSGESRVVGAFASVNESVWEHFKQGFWPMCLFATIEYLFPKMRLKNFLPAKAVAVYVIPIFTGLAFYGYSAVIGQEIFDRRYPYLPGRHHYRAVAELPHHDSRSSVFSGS